MYTTPKTWCWPYSRACDCSPQNPLQSVSFIGRLQVFCGYMRATAYFYNHMAAIRWQLGVGHPPDLLLDIPFLLLAWLTISVGHKSYRPLVSHASCHEDDSHRYPRHPSVCTSGLGMAAMRHSPTLGAMTVVVSLSGYAIINILSQTRLQQSEDQLLESQNLLKQAASIDPLTGGGNRRAFDQTLAREWEQAGRTNAGAVAPGHRCGSLQAGER